MPEYTQITTPAGAFDALAAGPDDGPGALLLHGFPEAAIQWEHQLDALAAAGYRAVAPDQRGYSPGARPERVEDYAIDELVGDALAIADALGWGRLHLIGHDWGAAVGWAAAERHPDRLASLSAVSVPHLGAFARAMAADEDQQTRSAYMREFRQPREPERRLLEDGAARLRGIYERKVPPGHVEEYVQRLSEPGALTAALNWYRAMGRNLSTGEPVTVPTLYVWSTDDVAIGSVAALDTENWVSGPYRFEMLEDVSHWVPEEAPQALAEMLLEHLAAHPA